MSVTSPDTGELFIFRIIKSLATNPDRTWANSYEFRAESFPTTANLLDLLSTLVVFEQSMTVTSTIFLRGSVSTWTPDSTPYDPESFISTTLTASGVQTDTGNQLPLQTCLSVSRNVIGGRLGHLFFRNFLRESEVSSPAGVAKLDDRAAQQSVLDDALDSSGLLAHLAEAGTTPLTMVMINKDGTNVRPVMNLRVAGVAQVPIDHKWYNRRSGPVVTD